MNINIFEFFGYKKYLNTKISSAPMKGRGIRKKIAKFLNCQPTYVSRVLKDKADFSLEQAVKVNTFFKHSIDESRYFILLLEYSKAGSSDLKSHFLDQIKEISSKNSNFKSTGYYSGCEDDKNIVETFYSSWLYGAVHVLTGIPKYQTLDQLSDHFSLPESKVESILDFLVKYKFVSYDGVKYKKIIDQVSDSLVDKDKLSSYVKSWRNQAIVSLDKYGNGVDRLHFSKMLSLSENNVQKIQSFIIETISEDIDKSNCGMPIEKAYMLNLDYFPI